MDKHKGFTIVELIIVIVVIAILASITVVGYSFMRADAMDARIRSAVKTIGDAITLYEIKENANYNTMTTGRLNFSQGVDNRLVPKYLKPGYRDGLKSKDSTEETTILWYRCTISGNHAGSVVYASLSNPTSEDIASFNKMRNQCSHHHTVPNLGTPKYNYAQLF